MTFFYISKIIYNYYDLIITCYSNEQQNNYYFINNNILRKKKCSDHNRYFVQVYLNDIF